jgi:hypothetical protein
LGTLTAGNIKAGGLESYASPPTNNHITFANTTVTTTKSTGYDIGGQEVETFDFTENGIAPGQTFVYEKRGAPKTRGYPGFCLVSDGKDGTQLFTDNGPSNLQMSVTGDVHHDSGGSIFLFNDTSIYFDGSDYITVINQDNALTMGSQSCTWDWWMYPTSSSAEKFLFSDDGESQGFFHIGIRWDADPDTWEVRYDTGSARATSTHAAGLPTVNKWNHVAFVFEDGLRYRMYLNGKFQFGQDQAYNFGAENFNIGAIEGYLTSSARYDGYIDDFRVRKGFTYQGNFLPPDRSPKDTSGLGDVADYTKITMMGERLDTSTYFTAIIYVAGDEVVATDFMGIDVRDLDVVVYHLGNAQKIMVHNNLSSNIKFTAYVEKTT